MIYFSDFGTLTPGDAAGALLYRQTSVYSGSPIEWNGTVYDPGNWHDETINPSQVVMPSGVSLVRAIGNIYTTNNHPIIQILKNGSAVLGGGKTKTNTSGDQTVNVASAPLVVSASNYLGLGQLGGAVSNDTRSWFGVEKLDASTKRALVYKSSTQALAGGVTTTLSWDQEEYDTDTFHDNSINNSRLTVPSGVTRVRITAGCVAGETNGQLVFTLIKNGSNFQGAAAKDCETSGDEMLFIASGVLEVTTGDYFEVQAFSTNNVSVQNEAATFFAIEEVPSAIKRCLAYRSSAQSFSAGVAAAVQWNAELYDTDSIHDNTTNPSRFIAPSGITEGRLTFNLLTTSIVSQQIARGLLNGSMNYGLPAMETDTAGTDSLNGMGAWVPMSPGDYFEVEFVAGANMSGFNNERSWACVEFR